jgi:hypothetical protein
MVLFIIKINQYRLNYNVTSERYYLGQCIANHSMQPFFFGWNSLVYCSNFSVMLTCSARVGK